MNKQIVRVFILLIIFSISKIIGASPENKRFGETPVGEDIPITGNIEQLKYFFDALENSKSEKIRIAHYGDSIIWGDVISEDLREFFQKKYGGHGIGFVSICSDDLAVRNTIIHEFSDDWDWASVFTKNLNSYPIGLAGTVAKASTKSSVVFKSKSVSPAVSSFSEVSIFSSNLNSNSSVTYTVDRQNAKTKPLSKNNKLSVTNLDFNKSQKNIKLVFNNSAGGYFYGVTLDSGNGVYVDNLPFRGNSGVSIRDLDEKLFSEFADNLNYKLFILQFGVNVAVSSVNSKWYERQMLHVIKKIKKYFPKSSILIVSPGDIGEKKGRKIVTNPGIIKFIKAQKKIAEKGKVAFWNMFEAMGGKNSISTWVEASPPLVFKDFCHLTPKGGKTIADKLSAALMKAKSKLK